MTSCTFLDRQQYTGYSANLTPPEDILRTCTFCAIIYKQTIKHLQVKFKAPLMIRDTIHLTHVIHCTLD